jgi:tRNA(fMet)-specific endonuclease VapC
LDTNIVSYFMRGHSLTDLYRHFLQNHTLAISFMTVAEIYEGAARANWNDRKISLLQDSLDNYIVIPSSPEICRIWADIRVGRRRHPISSEDAWIAATALAHSCPLVTHDASDFQGIVGLKILTAY